jgi:hypothetical protein
VARGRKLKVVKPRRLDRVDRLRDRIVGLPEELRAAGYAELLEKDDAIHLIEDKPDPDPKTGGLIGKVREPLATYIQRVSIQENYSQRPPFDHAEDPIYRRLIRDFIEGAAMPEAKVAALRTGTGPKKIDTLADTTRLTFSVIDGLQRLWCFNIAIILLMLGEKAVEAGIVTRDAYDYFREAVEKQGDSATATAGILQRQVRYEVFYNIDLPGLLHYMVTFNTGQRRMNLSVQLEIMQKPLVDQLGGLEIPIWNEMDKTPGQSRRKDAFTASDLVLATQAFITANAHITAGEETERFLDNDQKYLDNVGDIEDVVATLKRLTTDIHADVMRVYAEDPNKKYVLSNSGTFFISLAAACGYIRNRMNMTYVEGALQRLKTLIDRPVDDPLSLDDYAAALGTIKSSRGKAIRRLVFDTFTRFFTGATVELEWLDTANQITG